jgi:hypothetical protein
MSRVAEDLFVDLAMAKLRFENGGTMTYALVDERCNWSTRTGTMNVNSVRLLHLDNIQNDKSNLIAICRANLCIETVSAISDSNRSSHFRLRTLGR